MKTKNYTIIFILIYLWMLVTSPQSRFPILGEIHFERIIVFLAWVVLLLNNKIRIRMSTMSYLILAFYLLLNISYFISPYQDYPLVQHWIENYWKYMILYFLILFSINDMKDIYRIFAGFVLILFLYQAHSWYDFLQGGSYVWQAGIKRIVGIWSKGVGAANYFGVVTLYSLPFALFWYNETNRKKMKTILIFYFVMSFFTIVYSGTRGALLGLIFFILINMRSWKKFKIAALLFIVFSIIVTSFFPDYLKHRYLNLISDQKYDISERIEEQQKKSAEGRLMGLIDGWKLIKKKPILGYGPNSSPASRKLVNAELRNNEENDYQMHNLYGQVMAETGFLGTFLFFFIIYLYFRQFRKIRNISADNTHLNNYVLALQNSILLMLFYGIASHTLYRYNWLLMFACHGAFFDIVTHNIKAKIMTTTEPSDQALCLNKLNKISA